MGADTGVPTGAISGAARFASIRVCKKSWKSVEPVQSGSTNRHLKVVEPVNTAQLFCSNLNSKGCSLSRSDSDGRSETCSDWYMVSD